MSSPFQISSSPRPASLHFGLLAENNFSGRFILRFHVYSKKFTQTSSTVAGQGYCCALSLGMFPTGCGIPSKKPEMIGRTNKFPANFETVLYSSSTRSPDATCHAYPLSDLCSPADWCSAKLDCPASQRPRKASKRWRSNEAPGGHEPLSRRRHAAGHLAVALLLSFYQCLFSQSTK